MTEYGKFLDKSKLADLFGNFNTLNIKRFGKGTSVYLYDYLDGASQKILKGTAGGVLRGLARILEEYANITAFATVTDAKDNPAQVRVFEYGTDNYLTFLGPITQDGEAKKSVLGPEGGSITAVSDTKNLKRIVKLNKPCHVYQVTGQKRYLGKTQTFEFDLAPAVGTVYACLETEALAPRLSGTMKLHRGKIAKFEVSGFSNTCRVTITAPDGKTVFAKNLAKGTFQYIPALNDASGIYLMTAVNVISNQSTLLKLQLK